MMKAVVQESLFSVSEIKVSYQPGFKVSDRPKVTSSNPAYQIFNAHWDHDVIEMTEQFYVLMLNNAGHVLGIQQISSGSSNGTLVDPKLVFAVALKTFCASLILAHNHPSQLLVPSEQDLMLTKKLVEAGKLLDVQVLDHLIVGKYGYYSFKDEGIM
ncbi:JAB domain-containing protein [Pedobacter jeongneungensis]|uniref:JAB domain-containing protein n=1 Tax=Pedobacter jeongneungensis TaxID=947309 RepID=A0ABP8BC32_9SPHI